MASSSGPHVLVAGGAGYIGSHTAKELRRAGMVPVVLDNLVTGNRFALRYGPFHEGSIADVSLVGRIVAEYRIESAILFAGHAYVGESTVHPRKYFSNNVSGSLGFLEALLDTGVRKLVFSSSCSIYGGSSQSPNNENCPMDPLSPYAETKLFLEKVLRWYDSAYAFRSVCLRYFNASGADPEGELGELHDPETHLIPLAIYAALGGTPLQIFGSDYPTPDGTAIRDYVHVSDLAAAHVLALKKLLTGSPSDRINLGSGAGSSALEVVRMVERVSGRSVPLQLGPRREGDASVLIADAAKAHRILAWTPRYSTLECIVGTAWRWHIKDRPV